MLVRKIIGVARSYNTYRTDEEIVADEESISNGVVYTKGKLSAHTELIRRGKFVSGLTLDVNYTVDCEFMKTFMMVPTGSRFLCEVMSGNKTGVSSSFSLRIAKDPDLPNFKGVSHEAHKSKLKLMSDNVEFTLDTNGKTEMESSIINSTNTGNFINVVVIKDVSEVGGNFISANVNVMAKIEPVVFTARKSNPELVDCKECKKLFRQIDGKIVKKLVEGNVYALTGSGYKETKLEPTHDFFEDGELFSYLENTFVNWCELSYLNNQDIPLSKSSEDYLKM